MFVLGSLSFRLLCGVIILGHDRGKIIHRAVTQHPTAAWISRQVTKAFPWDTARPYLLRDRDAFVWLRVPQPRGRLRRDGPLRVTVTGVDRILIGRLRGAIEYAHEVVVAVVGAVGDRDGARSSRGDALP